MRWRTVRTIQYHRSIAARRGGRPSVDVFEAGTVGDQVDAIEDEKILAAHEAVVRANPDLVVVAVDLGDGQVRSLRVGPDVVPAPDTETSDGGERAPRGDGDGRARSGRDPRRSRAH